MYRRRIHECVLELPKAIRKSFKDSSQFQMVIASFRQYTSI
eukprot:gene15659-17897_t